MEGYDLGSGGRQSGWHVDGYFLQHDALLVHGQSVEAWTEEAGKAFELVECAFLFKRLGIAFDGKRRVENAGTATRRFLVANRMRGRIGAEEEFG